MEEENTYARKLTVAVLICTAITVLVCVGIVVTGSLGNNEQKASCEKKGGAYILSGSESRYRLPSTQTHPSMCIDLTNNVIIETYD